MRASLLLVTALVVVVSGQVVYQAGYNARCAEEAAQAVLAHQEGFRAGMQERAEQEFELGRQEGLRNMLDLYDTGGEEALRAQIAVLKGTR